MSPLSDWSIYLWTAFGIFVSLILPVVSRLAQIATTEKTFAELRPHFWPTIRPYLFMGIFSFLTALVILAGVKVKQLSIDSTWGAFLLGYFADATVQKLRPSPPPISRP